MPEPLVDRLRSALLPEPARALPPRSYAVLATVVDLPERPGLLLERRVVGPNPWSGQLCFPGGRIEASDPSPLHAALRETEEEVGIRPQDVRVAGHLMDLETHLGHQVAAYVGVVAPEAIPPAAASPQEVAELLLVPLDALRDLGPAGLERPQGALVPYGVLRHEARTVRDGAGRRPPPELVLDYWHLEHPEGRTAVLWGLTGRLVAELLSRLYGWRRPKEARVVEGWSELEP